MQKRERSEKEIFPCCQSRQQGDQIGQIFSQWAIVYLRQLYKDYKSSPKCLPTFFLNIDYVIILTKNWLGYVLGDFSQTHLVIKI
jgi:hypothetical protein